MNRVAFNLSVVKYLKSITKWSLGETFLGWNICTSKLVGGAILKFISSNYEVTNGVSLDYLKCVYVWSNRI